MHIWVLFLLTVQEKALGGVKGVSQSITQGTRHQEVVGIWKGIFIIITKIYAEKEDIGWWVVKECPTFRKSPTSLTPLYSPFLILLNSVCPQRIHSLNQVLLNWAAFPFTQGPEKQRCRPDNQIPKLSQACLKTTSLDCTFLGQENLACFQTATLPFFHRKRDSSWACGSPEERLNFPISW